MRYSRTLFESYVLRPAPTTSRWIKTPRRRLDLSNRFPTTSSTSPSSSFETLATDTTVLPSLQVPKVDAPGQRTAVPRAGNVPVEAPAPASIDGANAPARARTILGVRVPTKPSPPEEGECCMSGCAHCVYDLYLEDLEHFHDLATRAKREVLDLYDAYRSGSTTTTSRLDRRSSEHDEPGDSNVSSTEFERLEAEWPTDVFGEWRDAVDDGNAGDGERRRRETTTSTTLTSQEKAARELDRARQALDPATRAFLEMEAKIKARQNESGAT
ncbi:hypothetical protein JCM10212_003828 [Sporobolomyces blumeae]